jgi:hypothetical protein
VERAIMQADGNFVLYDSKLNIVFSTDTQGHPGSELVLVPSKVFRNKVGPLRQKVSKMSH